MTQVSEKRVKDAIGIILSDTEKYDTSLNWAVSYCKHGMALSGRALEMQIPYILNNIEKWRHPEAKQVREVLKQANKFGIC